MNDKIPNGYIRFLRWICPSNLYEGIEGDILEQFEHDLGEFGINKAKRNLTWNVILFARPGILLRNKFSLQLIHAGMIRNYLIIAFRNVFKSKAFSFINVFGLGIGLASCLLIFQFVVFELSYDKFHEKHDRIYRVTNDRYQNGKLIQHGTITYPTIGAAMASDFPEVESHTRLMPVYDFSVKAGDRIFTGDQGHFADEHFLTVFDFPLLAGEKRNALKDRRTVILTAQAARKYFNIQDQDYSIAINKEIYWGTDPQPYKVTAVCTDVPENSHIQFDALVSYATLISPENQGADDSWTWSDMFHYIVLKPGVDYKTVESKFEKFSERHFQGDKVSGSAEKFFLQPLKEVHLYSDYEYDFAKTANGKAVWIMLIVAGFILLIAWINYINLTTSRSLERAKEVGLRKVMGAMKSQLIFQFIFESILISFFAFVLALIIIRLSAPSFREIIGTDLSWWRIVSAMDSSAIVILILVMILGVLLSGFYPAFILSRYQPVTVLKGKFQRSTKGNFLRKGLVVFQFMAAGVLITGTIIVSRQLKFMNEADLGINIKSTVIVQPPTRTPWDSTYIQRVESYKGELSQINGVRSASLSNLVPGQRLGRAFNIRIKESASTNFTMSFMAVDYQFFDTYSIRLVAGRKLLPKDFHQEWNKISDVVLNATAIKLLGIEDPQDAIGKDINFWNKDWTIVGVVSDFHQESLKKPLEPILFFPAYNEGSPTSIKLESTDLQKSIAEIEIVYRKFFPDNSFEYFFLEDKYKTQYRDDNRFSKIVSIFTVLAIIISSLGLIGLSSYTAVQRTKEIGIRKVLGASIVSIVSLLSMDFIKIILLATVASLPVSYYALQNWLDGYAYRIPLGWILFGMPITMILLIAAATISFQIIKTAMTNPADTLKYE